MTKNVKLSFGLTHRLAEDVRAVVESVEYASTGDVVREAIGEWVALRQQRAARLAELQAAVQAGIDAGQPEPRPPPGDLI